MYAEWKLGKNRAPDWFEFAGTENDAYRQIGNAVAVPMGRWIGQEIQRYLSA